MIVALSTVTAIVSLIGLVGAVRENIPLIIIYAIFLKFIFTLNFMIATHLKPWLMAAMVIIVLLAYSFCYLLRRERISASVDIDVPEVEYHTAKTIAQKEKNKKWRDQRSSMSQWWVQRMKISRISFRYDLIKFILNCCYIADAKANVHCICLR